MPPNTVPHWLLRPCRQLGIALLLAWCTGAGGVAQTQSEYQIKAAILYNFTLFTEWPAQVGDTLNLCVLGSDPFGPHLDALHQRRSGARTLVVHRFADGLPATDCQVAFISRPAMAQWPQIRERLRGSPTLTVADSPRAAREGVALNMLLNRGRVAFEANHEAARGAGLGLSSKLLQLATQVHP